MVRTRSQLQASQGSNEAAPASPIIPAQSSLGSAQNDTVELNWILFDKSHRMPIIISIPRNLYERPSQYCQPLFMKELLLRYKVATQAEDIMFWKTKEPLSIEDAAEEGWAESIDNFKAHFTSVLLPTPFSRKLTTDDDELVHLVITIRDEGSVVGQTDVDTVPEMKEFKRYYKTVLTPGMTPSEGAKSMGYKKIQSDDAQAIYDGRRASNGPISTIGPPIQIFHPIFDEFIHLVNDPDNQLTVDDLKDVQDLMYFSSKVGRSEDSYNGGLLPRLGHILQADIQKERNLDGTSSDGVVMLQIADARITPLVIELKRELGEGGCDPTIQVGLSMKRSWISPSTRVIREKCCCPTFLVAGGGPWLNILGGVFTDKFIVQRLTDMKWMALSSTEEDKRVYHNAKVLVALRKCLVKLHAFYMALDAPPFVTNQPHPRYFPYPTSFITKEGSITHFRYLKSLEGDAACVTYLAEILNEAGATGDPVKVVIKFVARYGKEVHEFLARKGCAPTLQYYGPLPATKPSSISLGHAQSAPPGLCLRSDLMHMVVMDYIHAQPNTPPDVREQIQAILFLLHSKGYVFGDLRKQNILFDGDSKVKLIDFNWCGRYDMNIRDEKVPSNLQNQIDQNKNRVQVGDVIYAYYPLSMSTLEGMWARGMQPLAEIRPEHDWMMLDKLLWL